MATEKEPGGAEEPESVLALVTALRDTMIARAEGLRLEDADARYQALRAQALGLLLLRDQLPASVVEHSTLLSFWYVIKSKFSTYAERRTYLVDEFRPLIRSLEADTEALGDYKRERMLGQGGFGQVWLYRHRYLDLPFAFKFFKPHPFNQHDAESATKRFFREARILFQLRHDDIIQIYDVAMLGKAPFIRMEYLESEPLETWWRNNRPQPVQIVITAAYLVKRLSAAMAYAHRQQIVHRDLKPNNILIGPLIATKHQIRIIDFGMGAFIDHGELSRLTRTNDPLHSGGFIDPELRSGAGARDPRVDVYSLGAIWFFLLTNRTPHGTIIERSLKAVENLPAEHSELILQCLGPIDERPKDGGDLEAKLREILRQKDSRSDW
ncbi:serine/threonine protein kinase [Myxococcota bacterium]|nr:serine/threonine protein kinase [Myxococcota bacterium]